jgi:hypothetical protein
MTDQPHQTSTAERAAVEPADPPGGLSILDMVVLALCVVGVLAALALVLDYSGITLFDGHAAEVIADAWNRNATIGLIVAIVTAIAVGIFVWLLAKSTLGSDKTPEPSADEH